MWAKVRTEVKELYKDLYENNIPNLTEIHIELIYIGYQQRLSEDDSFKDEYEQESSIMALVGKIIDNKERLKIQDEKFKKNHQRYTEDIDRQTKKLIQMLKPITKTDKD